MGDKKVNKKLRSYISIGLALGALLCFWVFNLEFTGWMLLVFAFLIWVIDVMGAKFKLPDQDEDL